VRLKRIWWAVGREVTTLRTTAREVEGHRRITARARHQLGVVAGPRRLDEIEARLSRLEAGPVEHQVAINEAVDAAILRMSIQLGENAAAFRTIESATSVRLNAIDRSNRHAWITQRINTITEWVRQANLDTTAKISVVMATRNRADMVRRAVDSVRNQIYPHWELIVVDDGSTDATPAVLEQLRSEDARIVVVTSDHGGVGNARNAGLVAATADIVCYLDDDNRMEPLWLKAVAWAFDRQPNLDVLYGARIVDVDDVEDGGPDGMPYIHFVPFDRRRLEEANFIDLGVVAHRRLLEEARFDETLEALGDWDLVLRLTEASPPLALPVVASTYLVSAPGRISRSGKVTDAVSTVHTKMRRLCPIRVLGYNSLYPLLPETYIGEEMKALTDHGATLAWYTDQWSPSPVTVHEPLFTDIDTAVNSFAPDVLVLFWATFAAERLEEMSRIGLPFALRVHSFDFDLDLIERVRQHPLCVGVWAYPQHASRIEGAHELAPLIASLADFPEPARERPVVLSASACLPKKDWPTLVSAFADLAEKGADCRIVVAVTHAHEDEPARVKELITASGAPIKLSIDVPHDQVVDLLARTAAVVYTKTSGGPFGMPRSIIEGQLARTCVVLPRRPEAPLVAGPDCRTYVTSGDIVRHVTEILAGGPQIEAERLANRRFAFSHFADPQHGAVFAAQLTRAVNRWKLAR
jgi:glycosyltransferase involved in cell wall biosynthesis